MERGHNRVDDLLDNIALRPDDITFIGISKIEIQTRPSILDTVCNWNFFNDDEDILRFLNCIDKYEDREIYFNGFLENTNGKDTLFGKEAIQLKINKIPKGLVALERIFDSQDTGKTKTTVAYLEDLEEVNYIANRMKPKVKEMLVALLRKYRHVFTWSYDDLKAYKEELFQHKHLKEDAKSFRKRKRPINPTLAPKMQEELVKLRVVGIIKPIKHSSWVSN